MDNFRRRLQGHSMFLLSHFSFFTYHFLLSMLLVVGLNTSMASEYFENSETAFFQEGPPDKKKDQRRRGDCEDSPSLWTLNLCETHKFCYLAPETVNLWPPKHPRGTKRLVIKNTQTQQRIELTWRSSKETMEWPIESLPIESGTAYLIQLKKRRIYFEREIYLYQVPNYLTTTLEQVDWMKEQGCAWQVEMFRQLQE